MAYNGGCVLAMKGKDCVAIATDKRFGVQLKTMSTKSQKVFQFGPKLFLGLSGLATDIKTVSQRLKFRVNMYELRENRKIKPKTLMSLVSNFLYEKRFSPYFVEPIIAGIDEKTGQPLVNHSDLLGSECHDDDFVCTGTCEESLLGMCETVWEPDMSPEQLFEAISQALINSTDRDAISGWGATVYIIEKDAVTIKEVKTRMD